jgi:predicted O-methyltransferase YrrM
MKPISARRFSPMWWLMLPWSGKDYYRRLSPPDAAIGAISYWWHGDLPRRPIEEVARSAAAARLSIVNPGRRDPGTSVTLFELNCILMLMDTSGAKKALEIGTFDGNTTLNIAANLPSDGEVVTIDLPLEASTDLALAVDSEMERNLTDRNRVGEQFRDDPLRQRIRQVFGDSAVLEFSTLGGPFDFAFIDGCHAYAYVKSDTEKVMRVMRPGGIVVWHDYAMMESVSRAVDEFRGAFASLCAVQLTRLAVGVMK